MRPLKLEDITNIIKEMHGQYEAETTEEDVLFAALTMIIAFRPLAFRMAFGRDEVEGYGEAMKSIGLMKRPRFQKILEKVYEVTGFAEDVEKAEKIRLKREEEKKNKRNELTREQNKSELIELIERTEALMAAGKIDFKDGAKMVGDWRKSLNDKFDMEKSTEEKRLIEVPAKHDYICEHTHRECYVWPSKEACMKKYGLTEKRKSHEQNT